MPVSTESVTPTVVAPVPSPTRARRLPPLRVKLSGLPAIRVHVLGGRGVPTASTSVLVVLHGAERNPLNYLQAWEELVSGSDVLVLAPEFDEQDFEGSSRYNLGAVLDEDGRPTPPGERTFAYVPAVVEKARQTWGLLATDYAMFGHSAGAQFVHRYLAFTPDAPVRRAVAANAGWYTMPDPHVDFPYGWRGAPAPISSMASYLQRDLVVLLGDADVDAEMLRQDPQADRQGATRIERGRRFFREAQARSRELGVLCRWRQVVVPGVGHDQALMARAAWPLLQEPS